MKAIYLLVLGLVLSFQAWAEMPYSQEAFKKSQQNNEKIILHFNANWCPVCKNENRVFAKLNEEGFLKDISFYKADFDTEHQLKQQMKGPGPGSLILFIGGKEVARTFGYNTEAEIKKFISDNLK